MSQRGTFQFISSIFAIGCGTLTWTICIGLLKGAGFYSSADAGTWLVFLSPILLCSCPVAFRRLWTDEIDAAVWLAALAPVLGLLNVLLAGGIGKTLQRMDSPLAGPSTGLWIAGLLWLPPFLWLLCSPLPQRPSTEGTESTESTESKES